MIQNACHFAEYANDVCNVNVLYLDKNDIQYPNIDDSVYVHGTLKVHQVKRINKWSVEFFFNSQYKKNSEMLRKISYGQLVSGVNNFNSNDTDADEIDKVEPEVELTPQVGDVVIVKYASKQKMLSYVSVIQSVIENQYHVQYMKKSGEKTFTLKEGDCVVVSKNNIVSTIKNFKLNT